MTPSDLAISVPLKLLNMYILLFSNSVVNICYHSCSTLRSLTFCCIGGNMVAREDIMEAVERAKFGINDGQLTPNSISKGLVNFSPGCML